MNEQKFTQQLNRLAERDIPAERVSLWAGVAARLTAIPAPRSQPTRSIAWSTAALVVLALIGLLVAPRTHGVDTYDGNFREYERFDDFGVRSIYAQGLNTPVKQSYTDDYIEYTIDWVYADPVRVLIAYQVRSEYLGGVTITGVHNANGVELVRGVNSGGVWPSAPGFATVIDAFYVPRADAHLETLDLTVTLRVAGSMLPVDWVPSKDNEQEGPQAESFSSEQVIQLSIPMTSAHILESGQRVEAAGVPLTLERLVIAPSATRADICYDPPQSSEYSRWLLPMGSASAAELKFADQTLLARISNLNQEAPGGWIKETPIPTCTGVWFLQSIPIDASDYTFSISALVGITPDYHDESSLEGPWIFELAN